MFSRSSPLPQYARVRTRVVDAGELGDEGVADADGRARCPTSDWKKTSPVFRAVPSTIARSAAISSSSATGTDCSRALLVRGPVMASSNSTSREQILDNPAFDVRQTHFASGMEVRQERMVKA